MLRLLYPFFLAGAAPAISVDGGAQVNPIRKVVDMLEDMRTELEHEKNGEGELFEKVMCACETGESDLKKVIDDSTSAVARLTSQLQEESASKDATDTALKEHYAGKAQAEADLQKATSIRSAESKKFSASAANAKSSISALNKAIPQLDGGLSSSSFMQQDASPALRRMIEVNRYLSSDKRDMVLGFLDAGLGDVSGQPSAPVAEVVGVLKNLRDEMSRNLEADTATERTNAHSYGELKEAKQQEIKVATEAIIEKETRSGTLAVSLSTNKGALEDANDELADAQRYLADLTSSCSTKGKERDIRAKMRADEIAAISDAISILNEDDSLEVFKKAVPSAALLSQTRKSFDAFLQTDGVSSQVSRHPGLVQARGMISQLAKKHPSVRYNMLLMALNGEVRAASAQPADEEGGTAEYAGAAAKVVTGMVDSMVHVLHDEDVEDEHKKDFCANETAKTTALQADKQQLTDSLSASISEMSDSIASISDEIKTLQEEINANDKEVYGATTLRQKEHQDFVDAFSTMDTARRLLDKAAIRLHKFYHPVTHEKKVKAVEDKALRDAGLSLKQVAPSLAVQRMEASFADFSFLQRSSSIKVAPPVIPETPTDYVKKESGGVLGLLNTMKEDLTADMSEAETEEKFSAKDYVRVMKEAKDTREQLVKTKSHKKMAKAELQSKKTDAQSLRTTTLKELDNLQLYLIQLQTECSFLTRNYDARHEGRIEEEVGLEDAKTIVTHEEPPPHAVIKQGYKDEHGDADVDEHFPDGEHIHAPAPATPEASSD